MRRRVLSCVLLILAACTTRGPAGNVQDADTHDGWKRLPPAPTARTEVAGAVLGEAIYVIGGFLQDGSATGVVEVFDIKSGTWSKGPELPVGVDHPMSAVSSGRLFVFGGNAGGRPSSEVFELVDGRWAERSEMPEPRSAGGAATLGDGSIIVVGGVGAQGLATTSLAFDVADDAWSTIQGLSSPREHLGVAAVDGDIYVVGGRNPNNVGIAEVYTAETRIWSPLPDMPTPRGGLSAAGGDDLVVAVGGESSTKTYQEVEVFDIRTRKWSQLDPLLSARHGLAVVLVNGHVYAICGGTSPGLSTSGITEVISISGEP